MTDPTPQPDRIVPSACRASVVDVVSSACNLGTKCCTARHEEGFGRIDRYGNKKVWTPESVAERQDALAINRLNHAVDQLAEALAAAGGDLLPYEGKRQSDIALAALEGWRKKKPKEGNP